MRAELCACGEYIIAPDVESTEWYVQMHQASTAHTLWREYQEKASIVPDTTVRELELEKVMHRPPTYRRFT